MKRRFSSSRWLALFLSLLLLTATACVRSKPSPTPIPTETPVPIMESDITPAGGPSTVVAVGTTPQAEASPTDETATTVEATPVVTDTAALAPPPTAVPSPPPEAAAPPSGQVTSYTVTRGDTVYSIARRFNTTPAAIIQLNNLANPNQLVVGQTLLIPGAEAAGAGAQPASPAGGTTYIVQVGDTMFSIAQRYGTTVDTIAQANNIFNPWYIYVGQQLIIPSGTGESAPSGAPESAAPSGPGQDTYTVQPGDTLYAIALRFDTTVQALIALNNLSSFGVIYPGQVLRLP